MAYLLALGSAALYGAADFFGGLASRRTNTLAIVVASQGVGLVLLALMLPLLPEATPSEGDLVWGGAAGLAGGIGVTLLYRALAVGRMAVVAPTTAVCAVMIPVVTDILRGERLGPLTNGLAKLGVDEVVDFDPLRCNAGFHHGLLGVKSRVAPGAHRQPPLRHLRLPRPRPPSAFAADDAARGSLINRPRPAGAKSEEQIR